MGYLIAGVLIGPHGLKLISDVSAVKELAEIGVVLLLFVIGLEFSLGRLLKNLASVLGAGCLQLGMTRERVDGQKYYSERNYILYNHQSE
jgi:CPA2 family monovalent cation:H+ antiporter-2